MDTARKVEGLERFLMVSLAVAFVDAPQLFLGFLTLFTPIFGVIAPGIAFLLILTTIFIGVLGALSFAYWLSLSDTHIMGERLLFRVAAWLLAETIPFISLLPLLSIGIFVGTGLHNRHVERQEKKEETNGQN